MRLSWFPVQPHGVDFNPGGKYAYDWRKEMAREGRRLRIDVQFLSF
jgi:hypothetical protein